MNTTSMITRLSVPVRFFSALCLTVWMVTPRAPAQTPASLEIQAYAGLTITGAVGTVYSVQCISDLAQTNTPSAWRCLEFLQLPTTNYLWTDKSSALTGQRFYRAVAFPAPTNLVFIPPGTFRMGSPSNEVGRNSNEGPQTAVTISRGFWMGKYEVTRTEYQTITGETPDGTTLPMLGVSWDMATNYCALLTQQEQLAGRIATNGLYRLPTEAEWEYACRAGTSDRRFSYGDDPSYTNLTNYAWYTANSGGIWHPVGQKLPNPWGLYDIHGNAREWCQDWFGPYSGGIAVDPQGPATGLLRVIRGGSYAQDELVSRSAQRNYNYPTTEGSMYGFRVVLVASQP